MSEYELLVLEARDDAYATDPTFMGRRLLSMSREELLAVAHSLGVLLRLNETWDRPVSRFERALVDLAEREGVRV